MPALTPMRAEEFEAVSGRASPDYIRAQRPDGTIEAESYAFGKGGYWSGPIDDKTIARMDFLKVAHVIAVPLAQQRYLPAKDPKTTKLLIMVYWGTTFAAEHESESAAYLNLQQANTDFNRNFSRQSQKDKFGRERNLQGDPYFDAVTVAIAAVQAENRIRDLENRNNAMMLGYDSWWANTYNAPNGTPLEIRKRDMLNELEEDRYFVVLMAYDFQLLAHAKKHKLLWETRFSIREHVNEFDKQLPAMALEASKYFGRDSDGLVHATLPDGHVDLGDLRNLGTPLEK
jgi:hypothetical protein